MLLLKVNNFVRYELLKTEIIQPGIWVKSIFRLSLFCFLDTFLKKVGVNQIMKYFIIDLQFIFRNVTEKEKKNWL